MRERRAYSQPAALWKGERGATGAYMGVMSDQPIRDFHFHIYFDATQIEEAKAVAGAAASAFDLPVGHFHPGPVGPHPRGSVQVTVPTERFGEVAQWFALNRAGLTIFAHASTGDDRADHKDHVIWFGPSEQVDLTIFG